MDWRVDLDASCPATSAVGVGCPISAGLTPPPTDFPFRIGGCGFVEGIKFPNVEFITSANPVDFQIHL